MAMRCTCNTYSAKYTSASGTMYGHSCSVLWKRSRHCILYVFARGTSGAAVIAQLKRPSHPVIY